MTQPNHEDAIASLLNQSLNPKGINVATLSKDNSLSILLSSTEPLEAQATAAFILMEIITSGITSLDTVKIYIEQEKTKEGLWERKFSLEGQRDLYAKAKKAYAKNQGYYKQISNILQQLQLSLEENASQLLSDRTPQKIDLANLLTSLIADIDEQAKAALNASEKSLDPFELNLIENGENLIRLEDQKLENPFFDEVNHFIVALTERLNGHQESLTKQVQLLLEELTEQETLLGESLAILHKKFDTKIEEYFTNLKAWVPDFVNNYLALDNCQAEYQQSLKIRKAKLEAELNALLEETAKDLMGVNPELKNQLQYNSEWIKIHLPHLTSFRRSQVGKTAKWISFSLAAAFASALGVDLVPSGNFGHPILIVAATASIAVGIFGGIVDSNEKKAWQQTKQDATEVIWQSLDESYKETVKAFKDWSDKNFAQVQHYAKEQQENFTPKLLKLTELFSQYSIKLEDLKAQINTEEAD